MIARWNVNRLKRDAPLGSHWRTGKEPKGKWKGEDIEERVVSWTVPRESETKRSRAISDMTFLPRHDMHGY